MPVSSGPAASIPDPGQRPQPWCAQPPVWHYAGSDVKTLERTEVKPGVRTAKPAARRQFRPKDLLSQVVIQGLAVAPDGAAVIYVRRTVEDNKYVRRLWRVGFTGGRP